MPPETATAEAPAAPVVETTTGVPPAEAPEAPAPEVEQPAAPEQPEAPEEEAPEAEPEGGEAEGPELVDEDWEHLYEKYPERDPRTAEQRGRAAALKEAGATKEAPIDPFEAQLRTTISTSQGRLIEAQQALARGEYPDLEQLSADLGMQPDLARAITGRGHLEANRTAFEQKYQIDPRKPDGEVGEKYQQLVVDLRKAYAAANQLRNEALLEYDPSAHRKLRADADIADATAVGAFYGATLDLAHEQGRLDGIAETTKSAERRIKSTAQTARQNGHTEAIAKAKAAATGRVMATAGTPGEPSDGELTPDRYAAMTPTEQRKLQQTNPGAIDRMTARFPVPPR